MPRFIFITLATFVLVASAPAQTSSPALTGTGGLPVLADGTPIKIKINRTISSSDVKVGEIVECEVIEDVRVGNAIVIQKGSSGLARISAVQSKKAADHVSKLEITAEFVHMADGEKASLRGREHDSDPTMGLLAFGSQTLSGKDIKLANGSETTAYINGNVTIDPRRFPQLGGATTPIPASVLAAETTELEISSQPVSAEVSVDNILVGETPVRVIVHNGDHVLALRVSGYNGWVRTIHTSGGTMPIVASLDSGENNQVMFKDGLSSAISTCASGVCGSSPGELARAAKAKKAQQNAVPSTDNTPKQ